MDSGAGGRGTRAITVLIAEDDEDDILLTRDALNESRLCDSFDSVRDGEELLDFLRAKGRHAGRKGLDPPGLILLDLNMPKMGGRQALRAIRSDTSIPFVPIVVLSTSQDARDMHDAYAHGANSYIVKPNDFDDLVAIMDTMIEYWFEVVSVPT